MQRLADEWTAVDYHSTACLRSRLLAVPRSHPDHAGHVVRHADGPRPDGHRGQGLRAAAAHRHLLARAPAHGRAGSSTGRAATVDGLPQPHRRRDGPPRRGRAARTQPAVGPELRPGRAARPRPRPDSGATAGRGRAGSTWRSTSLRTRWRTGATRSRTPSCPTRAAPTGSTAIRCNGCRPTGCQPPSPASSERSKGAAATGWPMCGWSSCTPSNCSTCPSTGRPEPRECREHAAARWTTRWSCAAWTGCRTGTGTGCWRPLASLARDEHPSKSVYVNVAHQNGNHLRGLEAGLGDNERCVALVLSEPPLPDHGNEQAGNCTRPCAAGCPW